MTKLNSLLDSRQFLVGFDNILKEFDTFVNRPGDKFPPHDIIKTDDHTYSIVLAVAGFSKSDITINVEGNSLVIRGAKVKSVADYDTPDESAKYPQYIFNGISNRAFTKRFTLQDNIVVSGAKVIDGMLTITLTEIVPQRAESTSIAID